MAKLLTADPVSNKPSVLAPGNIPKRNYMYTEEAGAEQRLDLSPGYWSNPIQICLDTSNSFFSCWQIQGIKQNLYRNGER